jgi:hypothetical protein
MDNGSRPAASAWAGPAGMTKDSFAGHTIPAYAGMTD